MYKLFVPTKQTKKLALGWGKRNWSQRQVSENYTLTEKLIYTEIILSVPTIGLAPLKIVKLALARTVVLFWDLSL